MYQSEGRVPPYDKSAEEAVLGAILLSGKAFPIVASIIEPSDFYIESHRRIFSAMQVLDSRGVAIDHVTLGNELITRGDMEKIGGPVALDGLTEACATTANVEHYANIVKKKCAVRRVIYCSQALVAEGYGDHDDERLTAAFAPLEEAVMALSRTRMPASLLAMGPQVLEMYDRVAHGYTGVPLPWPTINAMTSGMWPKTMTMFVARPGVGKCVRADTPILDPTDGIYRPIREVVRDGRMVLSRGNDGRIVSVLPDAFLYTGRKRCIQIRLASGRTISGTPEHPVMTVDGWRRLDEIAIGHHVETVRRVPEPIFPETPPDEEVILLAGLLAEGGYTSDSVSFSNQDPEMVSLVSGACDKYGIELRKTKGMRRCEWTVRWKRSLGRGRDLGPNPARVLLDKYGCGHRLAKEKMIPDRVFSLSNEKLALFLGVFWGCDGYVDRHDTGITLASEKMVRQIQQLLLRFGVLSNVAYNPVKLKGKVFDSWRLRVYSSTLEAFRSSIDPIVHRKQRALDETKMSNPNVDNVPMSSSIAARLREIVSACAPADRARRFRAMEAALGMRTAFSVSHLYRRDTVGRRTFAAFLDAFDCVEFRHLLENHWDEVVDWADDGEQDVYDLTVNGTHSFVANDIVVHNTFVAVIAARHAWQEGVRTLIVSPEMSKIEIAERFFSIHSTVSYLHMIKGTVGEYEMPRLQEASSICQAAEGLWIMDAEDDITPKGIEAAIRACRPGLVAIDSLYDLRIKGERRDKLLVALDWFKSAVKRFDLAGCGFVQLNRAAEVSEKKGGGVRLGTIALADEIGQDSHAVFALEQDKDMRADHWLKIKPLKLRRGVSATESVNVWWDFDLMEFGQREDHDEEGFKDDVPF
jgi:replicative DNA helicase